MAKNEVSGFQLSGYSLYVVIHGNDKVRNIFLIKTHLKFPPFLSTLSVYLQWTVCTRNDNSSYSCLCTY